MKRVNDCVSVNSMHCTWFLTQKESSDNVNCMCTYVHVVRDEGLL